MTRTLVIITAILLTSPGLFRAAADTVVLKSGRQLEGVIESEGADLVEIATAGGRMGVRRERIRELRHAADWENVLLRAGFELLRGNLTETEGLLRQARQRGASEDVIREWSVKRIQLFERIMGDAAPGERGMWTGLMRELAGLPPAPAQALIASAESSVTTPSLASLDATGPDILSADAAISTPTLRREEEPLSENERDFVYSMARLYHELGAGEQAAEFLSRLDPSSLSMAVGEQGFAQSVLLDRVKEYLNAGDFGSASELIGRMESAGMEVSEGCKVLLLVRWSAFERKRGAYDLALRILHTRLRQLSPEVAKRLMQNTLSDARQTLTDAHRFREAVDLYVRWGPVAEIPQNQEILATLHRQWGNYLLETGKPSEAKEVFREYLRLDPEADPEPLHVCEFRERYNELGENAYGSAFELGEWAEKQGLVLQAMKAYDKAANEPRLKSIAQDRINILQDHVATAHMDKCMNLLEMGRPREALEELDKFPFYPSERKVQLEIKRLRSACNQEISRRLKLKNVQAEMLLQDAERKYYMGRTQEALDELEQLIRLYDNTSASGPARQLLRNVEQRIHLQKLEGASESAPPAPPTGRENSEMDRELRTLLDNLDFETNDYESDQATTGTQRSESPNDSDDAAGASSGASDASGSDGATYQSFSDDSGGLGGLSDLPTLPASDE